MEPATAGEAHDPSPGRSACDVAKLIDAGPWSTFQKIVLGYLSVVFALDGLANQSLGVSLPALIAAWGGAKSDFAPIAAANLIGVAVGMALGGLIGDRVGRRWGLILSVGLFGAMTMAGMLATGIHGLMVFRLLDGLGIGSATSNGAAMITEVTPRRHRGGAMAFGMLFIPVGGVLANLLAALLLPTAGWRMLYFACGLLPLVLALFFLFRLPESPSFLMRGNQDEARLRRLLERFGLSVAPDTRLTAPWQPANTAPNLAALFIRERRLNTVLLWGGFFTCLMAAYSLFNWLPTVLTTIHFSVVAVSTGLAIFNLGGGVGSLASGVLVDRTGYRRAHIALCAGGLVFSSALALIPLGSHLAPALFFSLILIDGFFIAGIHNSLYTLAANIYPPNMRATGIGLAASTGRLGAVLSSYTGVASLQAGGFRGFFGLVSLLLGLCAITAAANAGKAQQ